MTVYELVDSLANETFLEVLRAVKQRRWRERKDPFLTGNVVRPKLAAPAPTPVTDDGLVKLGDAVSLAVIERAHIEFVLDECEGNRERAARVLDVGVRTLYRKIEEYGLPAKRPEFRERMREKKA